jgi:LysR family glycine cleavage system transcriptional activator
MQAAIDGAGVVLGRLVLAEGDVAAGRLVRPFKIALPLDVGYFLVRSSAGPPRRAIQCFSRVALQPVRAFTLGGKITRPPVRKVSGNLDSRRSERKRNWQ